jgi:hypothetical protein
VKEVVMEREARHHAYIDRIEDGIAVLLLGDEERDRVNLPKRYLPKGAREGQALTVTLVVDEEGTGAAKAETQSLIEELTRESAKEGER